MYRIAATFVGGVSRNATERVVGNATVGMSGAAALCDRRVEPARREGLVAQRVGRKPKAGWHQRAWRERRRAVATWWRHPQCPIIDHRLKPSIERMEKKIQPARRPITD